MSKITNVDFTHFIVIVISFIANVFGQSFSGEYVSVP